MKVGSIGYCTEQGLGLLLLDFYRHGVVTHPVLIAHSRVNHWDWYNDSVPRITDRRNLGQLDKALTYLAGMDVVLFFETPFFWEWVPRLRDLGVRTFLMPMHECMPAKLPYGPDFFINPSLLDQACYPERSTFIPVPLPDALPFRHRETAEVFVHNSGHGGLKGRNGTAEFVEALCLVNSGPQVVIRTQDTVRPDQVHMVDRARQHLSVRGGSLRVEVGSSPWEELWRDGGEGDVFVFPEKFNGLSLPLQEAYGAGMLVMATDRFPMNTWLPRSPLVPTSGSRVTSLGPNRPFDEAIVAPKDIAYWIDYWKGCDISSYSATGAEWRKGMTWAALKPHYMRVLAEGVPTV